MPVRKFKMRGGGITCPPGFHCMDTSTVLVYVLVVVALCAIGIFVAKQYGYFATKAIESKPTQPTVVVVQAGAPEIQMPPDPRFNPGPPERVYRTAPDLRGFPHGAGTTPINVPTGGYPDTFQQLGVLTSPGGTETSATPTRTILPLFGRKLATNRDRWNYYTRTDGINPVQVPLQFKRRNCDDDLGCEEINDGDSIGVPIMGQSFVANVYRQSTPRYIPNI
jgi:hypothetical protein